MIWNLRFIEFQDTFIGEDDTYIELCEVYYENDGTPTAYSKPHLIFERPNEIEKFIERVRQAASKPFLTPNDFPRREDTDDPWLCDSQAED
jgi:hypothetical protein